VLQDRGTLQIELNGTTAGSGYDQLNVHGTVNLAGITLNASLNYSSSVGDQFIIINNDGSDAVTGTFIGLAQNAGLSIGAKSFLISYTGGSGNDVVLTRTVTPAQALTDHPERFTHIGSPALADQRSSLQPPVQHQSGRDQLVFRFTVAYDLGHDNVVTNAASGTQKVYRLTKP